MIEGVTKMKNRLIFYLMFVALMLFDITLYVASIDVITHASHCIEFVFGFIINNLTLLFAVWFTQVLINIIKEQDNEH
jgi:hypothetical protein